MKTKIFHIYSSLALFLFLVGNVTFISAANKHSYWYQRAEEAYQEEDYDGTLQAAEQGVSENEKDGYCWALIAEINAKRVYANYSRALDAAEKALKYLPKSDTYWIGFVHNVCAEVYYKIDDYEQSEAYYRKALMYLPDNGQVRFGLADLLRELGRYKEANNELLRIVTDDPAESYVHAVMADNAFRMGDYDEARYRANYSLVLQPEENSAAHKVKFNLALRANDLGEAAQEFLAILNADDIPEDVRDSLSRRDPQLNVATTRLFYEQSPNESVRAALLGQMYYNVGDMLNSLVWFKRAVEIDPSTFQLSLAFAYAYVGLFDQAEKTAQTACEQDSTQWDDVSLIYLINGDLDKCMDMQMRVFDNSDPEHYRDVSRIYILQQRYAEALAYIDTALIIAPESQIPTYTLQRGEIYKYIGQTEQAQQDFELAYDKAIRPATKAIAAAYLGRSEDVGHFADSLQASSAMNWDDHETLAMLYSLLGDADKAFEHFNLAVDGGMSGMWFLSQHRYANIKQDPRWAELMLRQEQLRQQLLEQAPARLAGEDETDEMTEIPFTRQGGVNQVKCTINGLPLYFIFDTGASSVSISDVEANFMLRNGYLIEADFMGKQNYVTASGEIHEGTVINLREVRVGEVVLKNIQASVVKGQHAPLLLGQSVFRRFGTVEVDNNASVIRFVKGSAN